MSITISRIEKQKNKKNRYSLFSQEEYILGISEEVLIKFNLHAGQKLSKQNIEKIKENELYVTLRDQAFRFLARRPHSRRELKEKLLRKGYSSETTLSVLRELQEKKYINDTEFAKLLIKDEIRLKKNGPILIKNKLLLKGIELSLAEDLINKNYTSEKIKENCSYMAEKKLRSLADRSYKDKRQRVGNFLKRKGFHWDVCSEIINHLIKEEDNEQF